MKLVIVHVGVWVCAYVRVAVYSEARFIIALCGAIDRIRLLTVPPPATHKANLQAVGTT